MTDSVQRTAEDFTSGLTLGELKKLVAHAETVQLPDASVVTAYVAPHSQLLRLTVTDLTGRQGEVTD